MDSLILTAKLKLLPNDEQLDMLLQTIRAYGNACQYISQKLYERHSETNTPNSTTRWLYNDLRKKFPLTAQMTQSAIRRVCADYNRTYATKRRWWKRADWKVLNYRHSGYDLIWNRSYSMKGDKISISTIFGRIHVPFTMQSNEDFFDGTWRFGAARIFYKHGKWFISICCKKSINRGSTRDIINVVGVDVGINFLATTYDSNGKTQFYSGRKYKAKKAHYNKKKKELSRKNTKSAKRRLRKMEQRENCWMNDVNHCISKALVKKEKAKTLFVLEDLSYVKTPSEKVNTGKQNDTIKWAYYDLQEKIAYKAKRDGHAYIKTVPYKTSTTCPKCGYSDSKNRDKNAHIFECGNCNYRSNDDRIAAMNLHSQGKQYLASLFDGCELSSISWRT